MSEKQIKKRKIRINNRSIILYLALLILVLMLFLTIIFLINDEKLKSVFSYGLVPVILLFCVQFIFLIRFFMSVKLIDQNANELSQGNLNISDIMSDKTKGLESLTLAFNEMKRNLLSFIESTKSNVIILSDAVDKVTKSLDMSYKGNEQIASNMSSVAEKAQEQLKIVENTLINIQDVSERTNSITTSLANIEDFVENTVKLTKDGSGHLDKYNEQMNVISSNLSETATFIETLNSYLKEIDQVGGLIINITEQLKLLSLNSAVEAARAGEAGRGFVVVAQEMNKLSSATRESIGQINKLLSDILGSNEKVSTSIDSCVDSFNSSKAVFNSVKESFYTINKNANILNDDMKMVYEESMQISNNTAGIKKQGSTLHDASTEISSITQDVAAVTQEELAENEEINNQALSLQNMLSSIERLLKRFKTSIVPVSQVSAKRLNIVMLSPLDHPFWQGVKQGALYAKNELKLKNVDVEYIGYEVVDDRLADTFAQKIDEDCDGIILPGFVGDIETHIAIANRKNIPIMAFNCDFNEGIERLSYFGPDVEGAGITAGELISKAIDEEGQIAIIRGGLHTSVNKIRRDGVVKVIKKKKKIKLVEEIEAEINDDIVYASTKEAITKHPDIKGLIIVTGGIIGAAKAIEDMGRIGKTKIVCFDYDDDIIDYIKKGVIYTAMGQDPFGQGHDPIISMYNYLVAGEKPNSISYTRTEVIDYRSVVED